MTSYKCHKLQEGYFSVQGRFCTDSISEKSDPKLPSGRLSITSGRSSTSNIRPDNENFLSGHPSMLKSFELLQLHPSRCFNSTSGRHSVFDQLWDFFPKHIYGKTAATIRTMWIPVRTRSSIRQVVHSKSRLLDASLHGPDAQAPYMKIVCIRSTVRTTCSMVRMIKEIACS
jgi:hypothetical protein